RRSQRADVVAGGPGWLQPRRRPAGAGRAPLQRIHARGGAAGHPHRRQAQHRGRAERQARQARDGAGRTRDGRASDRGIGRIAHRAPLVVVRAGRLPAFTAAALFGFAANSLLCRGALRPGLADAATFTSIRLVSGALVLALLARRAPRALLAAGSWPSSAALFTYAAAFSLAYARIGAGVGALLLFGAVQATMIAWALRAGERPERTEW